MKLKKIIKIVIISFIWSGFVFSGPAFAGVTINGRVDRLIHKGIHKVHKEDVEGALLAFKEIIKQDEENPIGYFYIAALYEVLMQNYRTRVFSEKFYYYIDRAIELGEKQVEADRNDPWALFYLGGSYGYRAIDRSETGNWFGAFLDAGKGAEYLERAIRIKPELYDAHYGFGVYKYWRSVKSKVLWFLPGFDDEREVGIQQIKIAIKMGKYSRVTAKGALIGIYYNEKDYKNALSLIEEVVRQYPNDIYALRMKGVILYETKRLEEATLIFNRLSERLKNSQWKGSGVELEVQYYLTLAHYNLEKMYEYKQGCERLTRLRKKLKNKAKSETLNELLHKVAFVTKRG